MGKYKVIKVEKQYIGVHEFENFETAASMFNIFLDEAIREEELNITQAIYITYCGVITVSWEK